MGTILSLAIIATAIFAAFAMKKFYDRPYIVNFSLAGMLLLIVIRTLMMQPITGLGYAAILLCSIAGIFQAFLGVKSIRSSERFQA